MPKSWIETVFINFFVASIMGFLLRLLHITEISFVDFKHMMHAHSHVAMLGWLFLLLYGIILDGLLAREESKKPIYRFLFWAAQVCVVGMMISFPIQGYGPASLIFTTGHLLIAYFVVGKLFFKIRNTNPSTRLFIQTALILMAISTLGVWSLAAVKAAVFGSTAMYYASIQFFLHFQFNGWFTFAALGLVLHQIGQSGKQPSPAHLVRWFYGLLMVSLVLTYALSVAWSNPAEWLFWTNGIGVLIQLMALVLFFRIISLYTDVFSAGADRFTRFLYILAICSFAAKILIQTAVVIPQVAVISYTIRPFVVGFIHLTMLGSISLYLIGYLISNRYLNLDKVYLREGILFIATGFLITEILLFSQGLLLWMKLGFMPVYYELIGIATALIPIGVLLVISSFLKNTKRRAYPLPNI